MNLVQTIHQMTWRRFSTLLRGLGPNSAAASRAYVRKYGKGGASASPVDSTPAISDPVEAEARFQSMFAPRPARMGK
jgi:hypothetical protein